MSSTAKKCEPECQCGRHSKRKCKPNCQCGVHKGDRAFNPENPRPKDFHQFFRYWTTPQYICEFCYEVIDHSLRGSSADGLVLHHIDGSHENCTFENLMPFHRKCHPPVHNTGMTRTKETKQRMKDSKRAYYAAEDPQKRAERIEKTASKLRGTTHTKHEGFSELQSQAQHTSRMRTCECGMQTNAGSMAHHIRKTGHSIVKPASEYTTSPSPDTGRCNGDETLGE